MCGIAGCYLHEGSPDKGQMEAMLHMLQHRGPDDRGIHIDGKVGLVHTRLSIIDLTGGRQPLHNSDKTLSLIANGEIYNYIELRAELQKRDFVFSTRSDSETILHAYAAYGDEFVNHLNGMFAFALFDSKRQRLILARDRLGIKPLYFVQLPDRLAFASELKSLKTVLPNTPQIRPQALLQFLEIGFCSERETIIQGIQRVLPGEMLVVEANGQIRRNRYWAVNNVKPIQCSFEEAAEEFDRLIESVMIEHVRSDVPYGLFLSGGVDSGTLLAELNKIQDQPIRSFTIGYETTQKRNELQDALHVSKLFNSSHTSIEVDAKDLIERIPFTIWAADDLMRDLACLPTSILAEKAAAELKVVITGEGGDEAFAGYGVYRRSSFQRFLKNLLKPGTSGYRTKGLWPHRWSSITFGRRLHQIKDDWFKPVVDAWQSTPTDWGYIRRAQGTDITMALPNSLLTKVDRMLMAFGLEGRVPFLDHRVIEFGLALPDRLKIRSGQKKLFLKRWAEKHLSPDYLHRKKRGFHVPVQTMFTGVFLDGLQTKLLNNEVSREWFNAKGLRELFDRHRQRNDKAMEIWTLMQFAIWHYLYIEQSSAIPTPQENPLDWIS